MEQPDKELMSELEGIMTDAAKTIKEDRRTEMLGVLRTIAEASEADFSYDEEPYALILIQQVGLDKVAENAVVRPEATKGKSIEELDAEGYGGGVVTSPYQTKTLDDLREVLDSPANQLLTDITLGKKDWASVTRHKSNGAIMYMMVAGGCVTTYTKTPSGETITSHTDVRDESIDSLLKSICGECQELLRSQWSFTSHIQLLRNNYPKSYAELAKEMERKLEEFGDEE
jgi:hypothetical protein